ncbi:MAG: diadenylate cyclase CdaA [Lachnospiraceae bacterium]|nr:diadenylate cyclase CdaA [Lachnospiraceae bacterium]
MTTTGLSGFLDLLDKYISFDAVPRMVITDYVEILIIAVLVYEILDWVQSTKAWSLLRGIVVIAVFIFLAYIFQMNTIIWIVRNALNVAIMAVIVIFQPELRRALDMIGRKNILASFIQFNTGAAKVQDKGNIFTEKTINEIVKASYEMGKARTGALIVIARNDPLDEYIRTGIDIDGLVSNQLLLNIFEHNTPLHDGAVIIIGNKVVSATCYLPMSDNLALSKELGTRHRAGVGLSEVTDSFTIIVSEETGHVSFAVEGDLFRNVDEDFLRTRLEELLEKQEEETKFLFWHKKGKAKS